MVNSHCLNVAGHAVAHLIEALRYKLEVRGVHWNF
jgi:hypothetical protein